MTQIERERQRDRHAQHIDRHSEKDRKRQRERQRRMDDFPHQVNDILRLGSGFGGSQQQL